MESVINMKQFKLPTTQPTVWVEIQYGRSRQYHVHDGMVDLSDAPHAKHFLGLEEDEHGKYRPILDEEGQKIWRDEYLSMANFYWR